MVIEGQIDRVEPIYDAYGYRVRQEADLLLPVRFHVHHHGGEPPLLTFRRRLTRLIDVLAWREPLFVLQATSGACKSLPTAKLHDFLTL